MAAARLGCRLEQHPHALVVLARVNTYIELREVEPEQLDAAAQRGERAVGDPGAAVRTQAAVEHVEVLDEARNRRIRVVVEAPPDERQLSPVRLVEILLADRTRVLGQLPLVAGDRVQQLLVDRRQPRRDAGLRCEAPHVVAVAPEHEPPRALERLADRVGARVRVAVGIAADPGAEAERRRRARQALAIVGE